MTSMDAPEPKRRWFYPTPSWLVICLLAAECLLWLSERYQWFSFNSHKGWTVLIAVAAVGVGTMLLFIWLLFALLFRLRFQFSIRSLLVMVVINTLRQELPHCAITTFKAVGPPDTQDW